MKRGGVRSSIDVGKLSAAVARPGIDPRRWITFARVLDIGFDPDHGLFADVEAMPSRDQLTCLIGSGYAGDDYGEFNAPAIGSVVVVAIPDGDESAGPVIICQLWNGANAKPPQELASSSPVPAEATGDPTRRVQDGRTMRIIAKAGANIRLEVEGSGKVQVAATGDATIEVTGEKAIIVNSPDVRLGTTAGSQVARIGDLVVCSTPAMMAGPFPVAPITGAPTPTGGVTVVGQIVSGAPSVKS